MNNDPYHIKKMILPFTASFFYKCDHKLSLKDQLKTETLVSL